MPRLISSVSRILKFFFLSWLSLIGLWTFLPSPTIPVNSAGHDQRIQQTLTSGRTLKTIHRWSPFFFADWVSPHRQSPDCSGLIIDWRLVSDHDDSVALLEMGRDLRARINLTDAILQVQQQRDDAVDKNPPIYFSDQITVQVDGGDEDHVINMPWFYWADAAIFHNVMHGFTHDIHLRVVARRETETVEIWKAAVLAKWVRLAEDEDLAADFQKISPADRSNGVLASFSNIHHHQYQTGQDPPAIKSAYSAISDIITDMQAAELPSKTYTIRSWILIPLAPSSTIAFFLMTELLFPYLFPVFLPALAAYAIIVLICWTYYSYTYYHHRKATRYGHGDAATMITKKMGFGDWCSRFWMTRPVCSSLLCCCRCCRCCGGARRGRRNQSYYHHYWAGEKSLSSRASSKRVVIWGPAGPVYEE